MRSNDDDGPETGSYERHEMLEEYAAHVRSFIDVAALRPLSVVADTANGMGGLVVPPVFKSLPVTLEILFEDLDGTFPNHPADPIQDENLRDLKAAVLAHRADIGLAFDGDADRVFLVDEKAEPVSGSLTTALVARAMLEKQPGSTVLYNLICSHIVPETIRDNGGHPVRTRVGHSFIKQVMADTGAVFGGEHSGHYYFRDNYRADSGLIAALVVLEELSKADRPLSELLSPFRRYADSGEINSVVDDPAASVEALARSTAPECAGCQHRPHRRADRRLRRLVVQRAPLEHRAPAAPQRRSGHRRPSANATPPSSSTSWRISPGLPTEEHRTPRSAGHAGRHGPESSRISRDPTHHRPPATHHLLRRKTTGARRHGTGPALARGAGLSRGQGTAHVLRGREPAVQPSLAPQLRDPRRHPGDAHRRGRHRRRRRTRAPHGEGRCAGRTSSATLAPGAR